MMNEIQVKYFSPQMLGTLDLGQLFRTLFGQYGECQITFIPMTPQERAGASTEVKGIEFVKERYMIFHHVGADLVRQHDMEMAIVHLGQK